LAPTAGSMVSSWRASASLSTSKTATQVLPSLECETWSSLLAARSFCRCALCGPRACRLAGLPAIQAGPGV
jgi:hypothetical protein